jgi:hypothetical protein
VDSPRKLFNTLRTFLCVIASAGFMCLVCVTSHALTVVNFCGIRHVVIIIFRTVVLVMTINFIQKSCFDHVGAITKLIMIIVNLISMQLVCCCCS